MKNDSDNKYYLRGTSLLHRLCKLKKHPNILDISGVSNNPAKIINLIQEGNEEALNDYFLRYKGMKTLPKYLDLLKAIYTNNDPLELNSDPDSNFIDLQSLKSLKETIVDFKEIKKIVKGKILSLSFQDLDHPCFTLKSSVDKIIYHGKIDRNLQKEIAHKSFNFLNKEYYFELSKVPSPFSSDSGQNYTYTLLQTEEIP